MKPIGGFFELELPTGISSYHDNAIGLSTGRASLRLALKTLKPIKVYLPYYCCDALFEPCISEGVNFEFYSINENLEISKDLELQSQEILIYTNYFGIKQDYVNKIIKLYGDKLIIDDTHAFFNKGYENNYSFTSARKYFGVPDGAYLYTPNSEISKDSYPRNNRVKVNHNVNRLIGNQKQAYAQYKEYENNLNSEIESISLLSLSLLKSVNFKDVRNVRKENYNFLKDSLQNQNKLRIDSDVADPFCYPLLLNKTIEKRVFYKENIFIPSLWLDTIRRNNKDKFQLECSLSTDILPLPIDHRYTLIDLKRIVNIINRENKK